MSKINFGYASAAWMPHAAHPLRCILKQRLKLAQGAVYGQQKTFADFGSFQRRALPMQRCLTFQRKMRQCRLLKLKIA
ncbi:hypothetical protein BEN74_12395 [Acinetobacter sp. WCHAc010034]|nr:hypothetical protein BEN74_12395 [Acinetobacter sp. WCHAc010034]